MAKPEEVPTQPKVIEETDLVNVYAFITACVQLGAFELVNMKGVISIALPFFDNTPDPKPLFPVIKKWCTDQGWKQAFIRNNGAELRLVPPDK